MRSDDALGKLYLFELLRVRYLPQNILVAFRLCDPNINVAAELFPNVFWNLLALFVIKQEKIVKRVVLGRKGLLKFWPMGRDKPYFALYLLVEIDANAHCE